MSVEVTLETGARGQPRVWLVWGLVDERASLAAVCSSETSARLRADGLRREFDAMSGRVTRVRMEVVDLDHTFGESMFV